MPLNDIGPKAYVEGVGVATLAYTPLFDRAGVVVDLLIDKPSAADVWVVSVQGREMARFDVQVLGNQQPLSSNFSGYPKANSIFDFVDKRLPDNLIYPVPMGQTFTVASVGGATADITITFKELAPSEINVNMINHPQGKRFLLPLIGFRAANVTALGENTFDTQIGPNWFPNMFVDGILPPDWSFNIIEMFLEGGGRNTFSGAADHLSNTTYFAVLKNGQRLFTRAALGGIPLLGQAAAAGSANTVVGSEMTPLPAFQVTDDFTKEGLEMPIRLGGGDAYQFRFNVAGDVTGGATYAAMRQMFFCDVRIGSGF